MPSLAEELLRLARELTKSGTANDVEARRSVSTAYYALFHYTVTMAADFLVGEASQDSPAYALIYRAYDHRRMWEACESVKKTVMPSRARSYFGREAVQGDLRRFAAAFVTLQNARNNADYAPSTTLTAADAASFAELAELGMTALASTPEPERLDFLTFMLTQPRL